VTSQDVRRRIADAPTDQTLLLAPVEIVATYEWQIMSLRVAGYGRMVALGTEKSFLCWPSSVSPLNLH
jgi:hypothetical protein